MNYSDYLEKLREASLYSEKGDKKSAILSYLDSIELAPKESEKLEPLYALGSEFKDINPEEALEFYHKCAEIASGFDKESFQYCYFYNSHKELGELYINLKQFPKALLHLKKAYKEIMRFEDEPELLEKIKSIIMLLEKKSA
jgi:tetratricopeptide (TPR) repeat protein